MILKQEYMSLLGEIYFYESVEEYMNNYLVKLIDKLLVDQDEANLVDLVNMKLIKYNSDNEDKNSRLRSFSQSSAHSSYFFHSSVDEKS